MEHRATTGQPQDSGVDEVTRSAHYEVTLDAPPDVVWAAITDPIELERWFPLSASVTPGPGGQYLLRWRDRHSGEEWPVVVWEEARRLVIGMRKPDGAPSPSHILTDFVLEGHGDRTVLRVVASGFDPQAEWSSFYDGVRRGWRFELGSLEHYLAWHRGRDRSVAWACAPLTGSLVSGWRTMMGPEGWRTAAPLDHASPGDRYALTAPDGTSLSGTITVVDAPTDFSGTVDEFNNGLLRIQLEASHSPASAGVWLAAYGVEASRLAGLEERWQLSLEGLLGRDS